MKLPPIMDADDWQLIAQGIVICGIMISVILAFAATAGLAWAVFRVVGGL